MCKTLSGGLVSAALGGSGGLIGGAVSSTALALVGVGVEGVDVGVGASSSSASSCAGSGSAFTCVGLEGGAFSAGDSPSRKCAAGSRALP
jgi:hypothetical protein